ncbi:MAG: tetratricopeptide repeat protein [Thermoanaerobaculia bacterium]|nr:tetratricopeptide repeat protein [Thermoanaerobaculia bacterium]
MRKTLALLIVVALVAVLPAEAGWDEGVAAFTKKDYKAAAAEFQTLVEQQPESYRIQYMLGATLQRLGRKEEALNHLTKAYDLNPNDLSVKLELGKAYFSSRRYQEVARLLDTVEVGSLPASHRSALYQMRGEAKLKVGNDSAAYRDFRELAKLNPSDSDIQYKYGAVALKADQMEAALGALDSAVRADPSDVDKKVTYANALLRKARSTQNKDQKKITYLKASELAAAATQADGSFDNLMLHMSAQLGAGQYTEAVTTGERAAAKNPRDWIVPFYIGQAYTSSGRFQQALQPLNKALELAGAQDQKRVWTQIGFAHEKLKNYSDSISAYQNAGDQAAVARVQKNEQIAQENQAIEAENERIEQLQEEARRLEEQMKELEEGGDGGI